MTKQIQIFLPLKFYEELLYQYEDKDMDLRKLVFGILKPLAKQGKLIKLSESFQAKLYKDSEEYVKTFDLKDVEILNLKSNLKWVPKIKNYKIYKQTISDGLYNDIEFFSKILCTQIKLTNNSSKTQLKQKIPTCIEQVIHEYVIGQLTTAISDNIDIGYDEEFDGMENITKVKDEKINPRKKPQK